MNNRRAIFTSTLILLVFLAGCTSTKLITEGKRSWKYGDFEAVLPVGWVKMKYSGYNLALTIDGIYLQAISLAKTKTNRKLPVTQRKITEDMLLHEIAGLILDEMKLDQAYKNFEVIENKPHNIGGVPGFRLEFKYRSDNFVDYRGIKYGFLHKRKYYELEYSATIQHNYSRNLVAFDDFISSFNVKK